MANVKPLYLNGVADHVESDPLIDLLLALGITDGTNSLTLGETSTFSRNLRVSGDFSFDTGVSVSSILNEDDMASNSNTSLVTQSSLVTFVNNKVERLLWIDLVTKWTIDPVFNATITGGDVYEYTYDATTYYRFVPDPYDSELDQFFLSFDGTNLTGLVATRGEAL